MLPEIDRNSVLVELKPSTPSRIVDTIMQHRQIAMEAKARIEAEGTVVRTLKGDVIAHPAIKIHADSTKAEVAFLERWAARQEDEFILCP